MVAESCVTSDQSSSAQFFTDLQIPGSLLAVLLSPKQLWLALAPERSHWMTCWWCTDVLFLWLRMMNLSKEHHISLLDMCSDVLSLQITMQGEGAKGFVNSPNLHKVRSRRLRKVRNVLSSLLIHSQCYGFRSNSLQFSAQEPKNPWRELLAVCWVDALFCATIS